MKSGDTANEILAKWLKAKRLNTAQFNREMGYLSSYGYMLTMKSNPRPITFEVIGRLLVVYGLEGPAPALAEALRARPSNGKAGK